MTIYSGKTKVAYLKPQCDHKRFVLAHRQYVSRIRFCGWTRLVRMSPGMWDLMPLMGPAQQNKLQTTLP